MKNKNDNKKTMLQLQSLPRCLSRIMKITSIFNNMKWLGLRKAYFLSYRVAESLYDSLLDSGYINNQHSQTLIKRSLSKKLISQFGGYEGHSINETQQFLGFGLLHYSLVRLNKPKRILCIGSQKGFIPAVMALACKDNGLGLVDFVDAGYDQDNLKFHWGGIGFWNRINPIKHFSKIGVEKFVKTYVMTTAEFAKKFPNRHYQYIYVDGDHSYQGVKFDYKLFWPRLDNFGLMAFHDVIARGRVGNATFGVWKLWKEIARDKGLHFPFPIDSGLGIIQKRKK